MDDAEAISLVARHVGLQPECAEVDRLDGRHGLLVCRVRFPSGASYVLKISATRGAAEPAIAWSLSRLAPDATVGVIAYALDPHRELQWAVMEDLGATRVSDVCSVETLCAMAAALARVQIAALDRLEDLIERGLPQVLAAHWVSVALELLQRIGEHAVRDPMLRDVQRCAWSVEETFAAAALWPSSIVHGDLHAGNAAVVSEEPLRVKLLDWGAAYFGPAQLGLAELLLSAPSCLQQSHVADQVAAAYSRYWEAVVGKWAGRAKALAAARCLLALQDLHDVFRRLEAESGDADLEVAAACARSQAAIKSWLRISSTGSDF